MPSFDVVSEVDKHELRNAVDQANRDIGNRYDFKGSAASISLREDVLTLTADSDFQLRQMQPILYQRMAARNIDIACLDEGEVTPAGKGVRQITRVRQGIETDLARRMVRKIKDSRLKVQAQIQGEQLRVSGKKRDDLQQVIALLRSAELGLPLQFQNFRD
ncbi:YajQ family cyclic di-GMP-binding protein [Granulosicoccaceae sp. 1_MG-2023]|nr:YajQ family cyclic di-GMP-binding protein [Granulosicoccaceae sp. 1_MG-2023]